jgi:hypothetical protein
MQVNLCLRSVTIAESEVEIVDWQVWLRHAERQFSKLTSKEEVAVTTLKVTMETLDMSKRGLSKEKFCAKILKKILSS